VASAEGELGTVERLALWAAVAVVAAVVLRLM
jgi:hypothetical protein